MRVLVFDDVLFGRQPDFGGLDPEIELRFLPHADDAVSVVARERPDLVLMDYAMDEHLTGEEAVVNLRARWPRGQLSIVGISSDPHSNERMVATGADDALPKSHLRGYLRTLQKRIANRDQQPLARRRTSSKA